MAMHNTNSILKYVVPVIIGIILLLFLLSKLHHSSTVRPAMPIESAVKNTAAHDSAAESLNTLTAELSETKQKISDVSKTNETLKKQNTDLIDKLNTKQNTQTAELNNEIQEIKNEVQSAIHTKAGVSYKVDGVGGPEPITTVTDLSTSSIKKAGGMLLSPELITTTQSDKNAPNDAKSKAIPYYTIPANGTSVQVRLMTALVGRIPVKGVVVDPYPFKVLLSDDNLAANGLRIPHLLQMVVSGYCEGDLVIQGVRGWITSLTFVFDDGTISSTTSNDNDIGNFTKANSLGYLSDKHGNPFILGMKFLTNAPTYLGGNIALGVGTGMANAYAQSQTTNSTSVLGNTNTAVTGSAGKFVLGQGLSNGANEAQQWWHDREQQSFDAVYVAPTDVNGQYIEIAVNFAKEIHIDYNPTGRKLSYAHDNDAHVTNKLD
jgi:hypothetical protein